jgi:hypothetical protein
MDATNAETGELIDSGEWMDAVEQRPRLPRKIHLDTSVYRQHSARASGGMEDCDHDFNRSPDIVEGGYATWICLRCSRRVQYEEWK